MKSLLTAGRSGGCAPVAELMREGCIRPFSNRLPRVAGSKTAPYATSAIGFGSVALFALREVGRCGVFFSRQGIDSGHKNRPQILTCGRQPYEAPSPNPGGAAGEVTCPQAGLSDKPPAKSRPLMAARCGGFQSREAGGGGPSIGASSLMVRMAQSRRRGRFR